ncbi:MAG: hypothetical protein M0P33_10255, partial [Massilibacteroides sp.]|nr:hypothetical protein [Massilibacteroides sp.]
MNELEIVDQAKLNVVAVYVKSKCVTIVAITLWVDFLIPKEAYFTDETEVVVQIYGNAGLYTNVERSEIMAAHLARHEAKAHIEEDVNH